MKTKLAPRPHRYAKRCTQALSEMFSLNLMRISLLTVIVCVAAVAHCASAADRCQQISDIVGQAAVMKPKLIEQLKKDPQKGTLGEPWRHFAFVLGRDLEKLRVPPDEQQYIFKTVAALRFGKAEVDFDIFRDYFYLRCQRKERGLPTVPLASIPATSLTHCWDTVSSRPQLQACLEKLLDRR